MKLDKFVLGILALISLFIGFVFVVTLIGNIFPSVHKPAAQLVCRGQVQLETIKYSYKPGEMGWYHYVYCVDESGTKKNISGVAVVLTGLISSAVVFLVLAFRSRDKLFSSEPLSMEQVSTGPRQTGSAVRRAKAGGSGLERLTELKKMRDADLISEAEYEEKKAEIMDAL